MDFANRHQREQRRVFGNRCVNHAFVVIKMPAEQGAVDFGHGALAELLAECGVDRFIAGNHHQPGSAEIQTVYQSAAGEYLHQPMMHRIKVLRVFPGETQQPAGFIDQHQVLVLIENLNLVVARRGNKVINDRRHQASRMWNSLRRDDRFSPANAKKPA